jgi:hypothetical protein
MSIKINKYEQAKQVSMNEHILIDINIDIYIDKYTCGKIGRTACVLHIIHIYILHIQV